MRKKLILFDIDGTLLKGNNIAHRDSFLEVFRKIYHVDVRPEELGPPGRTDTKIIFDVLKRKGLKNSQIENQLKNAFKTMKDYFRKNVNSQRDIKILPGIKELLIRLRERKYILGITTGNVEEIGKIKLRKAGLLKFFQVGSFGDKFKFRIKLVENCIEQTEKQFGKIMKKDVFVIGDTPSDVRSGKKVGVKTIAVLTGKTTKKELIRYKPDYIFDDFSDVEEVIKVIQKG